MTTGKLPRVLLIDIETAPILGYTWKTYDTNIIKVVRDWYILCFAYKWLDEKSTHVDSLRMHPDYLLSEQDDFSLCGELWRLLEEADIVIAHNGNRFDVKKIQARLLINGYRPPSPFKTIDTLQVARAHFGLTSNKLDSIGEQLKLGRKVETGGFKLWEDVVAGLLPAWQKMEKYNKQDVVLLEKVYEELRPWMPRHPNMAVYSPDGACVCSHCMSKNVVLTENKYYTNSSAYKKYLCQNCGAWSRLRKADGVIRPSSIACDRR